ncbi:MAG: hypothetical protein DVB28_000103 [Verrucomicrobia bacterium]|nr:MAG: hypothetical protein DVB28_000103 [Verrucomicrobiota bacterium]
MSSQYVAKLEQIGRSLNLWRAELQLSLGLAVIGGWVWALGLLDVWLRMERSARIATWFVLLGLIGATLWVVRSALRTVFTLESVAATLEKAFPQLDNRLINYLQLSRNPEGDPFKVAYVKAGVPAFQNLDPRKMRDRAKHRRNWMAAAMASVLLLLPLFVFGQAWSVALWRTVNPFTTMAPPSLTRILKVEPGHSTVVQGDALSLNCTVKGFEGHEVRVEIEPNDSIKSVYSIGYVRGGEAQDFSYRLPKVTTGFRYRFRAGDAQGSEWFVIGTRPPPAFTGISIVVVPPSYMRIPVRTIDAREGRLLIPEGSAVRLTTTANVPLAGVKTGGVSKEPIQFSMVGDNPNVWTASLLITAGSSFALRGEDTSSLAFEETIPFAVEPDKAAGIEIVSPGSRATLPRGERPQIEFRVADDFGISAVVLEEVKLDATPEDSGTELKRWKVDGLREFRQVWRSETAPSGGTDVAYRLIAFDNKPRSPNRSVSANVVFNVPLAAEAAKQQEALDKEARTNIEKAIELQKKNLADTTRYKEALKSTQEGKWKGAAEVQTEIRSIVHDLLANPLKPLGNLSGAVQKLYVNEMVLVVDALQSVPAADERKKGTLAAEAVVLETTILKHLTSAVAAQDGAKIERSVGGLSTLLESLLRNQNTALKQTLSVVESKAKVGKPLVDMQDKIGAEMASFLAACKEEAAQAIQTDAALAGTIERMVAKANELKIRSDMVIAAERLEQNQSGDAVPLEERVVSGLKVLQAMFDQIKLQEEVEKRELLTEAVKQAKDKIEKLEALNEKVKEAMEQVKGQKNKDDQKMDEMEEEVAALKANIKEALLEIPNDLHIFTELNVANDLVEDVFSVFQEIEQEKGSEQDGADQVKEAGFAKEDALLAQMGEAKKRLDAMEIWLAEKPDELKVTTEAHDKAEMPESGIALAELAAAAQDLLSDLLKEDKKMAEEANDSATNHAMPDVTPGGEVAEGDISSFAAQGKSGNQTPDHKEQDGRSNVGRQGMSVGETAAGSGTIGEGDKNIEARRTEEPMQSGKVDLAGEADTKATGGGKLGTGKADSMGMGGGAERVDSMEAGSNEGMAALMARQADALYAKASMKNVRVDSLKSAAHELKQASDAVAKGNIEQMREFRNMAISSLSRATTNLSAAPSGAMEAKGATGALNGMIESGPDHAPPKYRGKVAEYYKALNGAL